MPMLKINYKGVDKTFTTLVKYSLIECLEYTHESRYIEIHYLGRCSNGFLEEESSFQSILESILGNMFIEIDINGDSSE